MVKQMHDSDAGVSQHDLLFVCSSGGHLAQLMTVDIWWRKNRRRWVSFQLPDVEARLAGEEVIWAHHPTTRNVVNLIRNFGVAWKVLSARRPDVILSTGAAIAVPFFVFGRVFGIPCVFIEVIDRLETPTLTGRICLHLATVFCVQLEEQLSLYPHARVIGPLL